MESSYSTAALVVMQARDWSSENPNCKLPKKAGDDSARICAIFPTRSATS